MANQRISVLDPVSALADADELAVVQSGVTKKVTATILKLFARTYPRTPIEIAQGAFPTDYTYRPGNVLRFGADPTGVLDSTAAFNLATRSDYQSTGNGDLNFEKEVVAPAGAYKVSSSIYIHKGQHFKGAGEGATRILATNSYNSGDHLFKLGAYDGGFDLGGLPPEISAMWIEGGPLGFGAIRCGSAGATIHDLFITFADVAMVIDGSDIRISNIQLDEGGTGIKIGGRNNILSNMLIYRLAIAIQSTTNCYDLTFSDVHCYFNTLNSVMLTAGITHRNMNFNSCTFSLDDQYVGFTGYVRILCSDASTLIFSNCIFSNMNGGAVVSSSSSFNNEVIFNDCLFDGAVSKSGYILSTTAYVAFCANSEFQFNNCSYKNLTARPFWVNGGVAATRLLVRNGTISNCATGVVVDVAATAPALGSEIIVQGLWNQDQQTKQPVTAVAGGWHIGGDGFQVLTGIGAFTVDQYPSGRDSKYFVDTSTSAAQIKLPRSDDDARVEPKHGDQLTFVDYNQDWGTNNVTFLRGDNTINNAAVDYVASTAGGRATFTFNSVTLDWNVS